MVPLGHGSTHKSQLIHAIQPRSVKGMDEPMRFGRRGCHIAPERDLHLRILCGSIRFSSDT